LAASAIKAKAGRTLPSVSVDYRIKLFVARPLNEIFFQWTFMGVSKAWRREQRDDLPSIAAEDAEI
jgi:hypothetical protein